MDKIKQVSKYLSESKISSSFSNELLELLKQNKIKDSEEKINKKLEEILNKHNVENIEELEEYLFMLEEDIKSLKESIKKLVKERDNFVKGSADWTDKEKNRKEKFNNLSETIKSKKTLEADLKKIDVLKKIKDLITKQKKELTKTINSSSNVKESNKTSFFNFQISKSSSSKVSSKPLYASKSVTSDKKQENETFSQLSSSELLDYLSKNKDIISLEEGKRILAKIKFLNLSQKQQDIFLSIQEYFSQKKGGKSLDNLSNKNNSEEKKEKSDFYFIPIKFLALNLEQGNTGNKNIDSLIGKIFPVIFSSYKEYLEKTENGRFYLKTYLQEYPVLKEDINMLLKFLIDNIELSINKDRFQSLNEIWDFLEEKNIKEITTYFLNYLLYKAENLEQVKQILEKYGRHNTCDEITLKNIAYKCESLYQFNQLVNKYWSNIVLGDSIKEILRKRFGVFFEDNKENSQSKTEAGIKITSSIKKNSIEKNKKKPKRVEEVLEELEHISSWEEFYKFHQRERTYINGIKNIEYKKEIFSKIINVISKVLEGNETQAFKKILSIKTYIKKAKELDLDVDLSVLENTVILWENQFIDKLQKIKKEIFTYSSLEKLFSNYWHYSSWIASTYHSKKENDRIREYFVDFFKDFLTKVSEIKIQESDNIFLVNKRASYMKTITFMVESIQENEINWKIPKIPIYSCSLDNEIKTGIKNLELEIEKLKIENKNLKTENERLANVLAIAMSLLSEVKSVKDKQKGRKKKKEKKLSCEPKNNEIKRKEEINNENGEQDGTTKDLEENVTEENYLNDLVELFENTDENNKIKLFNEKFVNSIFKLENEEKRKEYLIRIYSKLEIGIIEKKFELSPTQKDLIWKIINYLKENKEGFWLSEKVKKVLERDKSFLNNSEKVSKTSFTSKVIKEETSSRKHQISDPDKLIEEYRKNKSLKKEKQSKQVSLERIFSGITPNKKSVDFEQIKKDPKKYLNNIIANLKLSNKKGPNNKTWYQIGLEKLKEYVSLYGEPDKTNLKLLLSLIKLEDKLKLSQEKVITLPKYLKQEIIIGLLKEDKEVWYYSSQYKTLFKNILEEAIRAGYQGFYSSKGGLGIAILQEIGINGYNFSEKINKLLDRFIENISN